MGKTTSQQIFGRPGGNNMLNVKVEQIIDNIIIKDNLLLFGTHDEDGQPVWSETPQNKYMNGTDTYEDAHAYLFGQSYLNLNSAEALEEFKTFCINEFDATNKDYCMVKYNGLHCIIEKLEDQHIIIV